MSVLEHTPNFILDDAISFVNKLYGVCGTGIQLPSERDQNFLIEAESGEKFVLKIANSLEDRLMLEAQNSAMAHIAQYLSICPKVISSKKGDLISEVQSSTGTDHFIRLISYLPGIPLAKQKRRTSDLFYDLGRQVGQLDRVLSTFDDPAVHRDLPWDLANAVNVVNEYKSLITDAQLRELIDKFVSDFESRTVPLLQRVRRSVIYNDANNYNVIVGGGNDLYTKNQRVVGLIDFGDMVYSYTVGDLAIAIAYIILDENDPLAVAGEVIRGYHAEYALTNDEIAVLFGLVCIRLCVSACIAAYQQQQRPDNEYLTISRQPIRDTLPKLAQIHPRFAEATFRQVCGLFPVPASESLREWLQSNAHTFSPVLGIDLSEAPSVIFDLSVSSPLINGDPQVYNEKVLTERIFTRMETAGTKVGIGRYNEPRLIFTSPDVTVGDTLTEKYRTINLSMDLFAEPGTPVYAPLAGTVHAYAHNNGQQGNVPVIILKHQPEDGPEFYTLYGCLSEASFEGLQVGRSFAQGEQIGTIGTPAGNVGWTPHLHIQLITDLLELDCGFSGVCQANQRDVWTHFSIDPNLILRIPAQRFQPPVPPKAETLTARHRIVGRNLSIEYRNPVKVVRGYMQYLYDETGRKYIDAFNNVPHVGHCHPRVVQAGQEQMAILNTNTRYLHDFLVRYAERLSATMPDQLSVCFFVNSASEANELAIRIARARTKQRNMIVLENAYHGHTNTLIDISPYKHNGPGGAGAPSWVHTAPVADAYRGPYKSDDPQAGEKYAQHVQEIIEQLQEHGVGLAGYMAESYPSVGGQIIFPDGYLTAAYQYVREAGGLCIADEVQTGYGRIGTHFYAFEAQGVVPDIVVLGKPIGNGHPIGAVVTTPEIAASFDNGMEFFSTFGGNTVSCAIGLTVLEVVLEENLQEHALRVGNHLLDKLRLLADRYPIIGDVRGSGLFIGVELVRDQVTLEPAGDEALFIANRMREQGVLLGTDGPYHNVIKIRPPMPFSEHDADYLVAAMDKILADDFG